MTHAHSASDPGHAVRRRIDNLRRGGMTLEDCDPALELRLLLEQVEKCRVIGKVAVLARFTQAFAHLAATVRAQGRQLGLKSLVTGGRYLQISGIPTLHGESVHVELLSSGLGPRLTARFQEAWPGRGSTAMGRRLHFPNHDPALVVEHSRYPTRRNEAQRVGAVDFEN
jgi:hypothetical protein